MIRWSRNSDYGSMSVVETFSRNIARIRILTPLMDLLEEVPSFHENLGT
jgi:hypothetical protein